MQVIWVQNMKAATDEWNYSVNGNATYGYIHNYAGSTDYCWQAVRNNARISGIEAGREASMAKAEEALALPIEDFNAIVAAELREDLYELERKLIAVQPCARYMLGYHTGYEAGMAEVKRRISDALVDA